MKVVVVADLHIHPHRVCSRDGGHDRLMDGLYVLKQSLDLAERERAAWLCAGDLKVPKTNWPQEALTGTHEVLRASPVPKIILAGNHDQRGEGGTGVAPFKDCATVVEQAALVVVGDETLLVAPWDAPRAQVAEMQDGRTPLFAHGFLEGCMLGPEDLRIAKGVPVAEFGRFPVAFFGDVHKGQWRRPAAPGSGRQAEWLAYDLAGKLLRDPPPAAVRKPGPWAGEVFYAGSTYEQNWGEREDPPKGALLVDLATGEVRLVPLRSPRFKHFDLSSESEVDAFVRDREALRGHFVRVVYSGPPCEAAEEAQRLGDRGIFRSYQLIVRRTERPHRRAEIHAGLDPADLLGRYVDAKPPKVDLPRELVLEALLRLYRGDGA